MKLKTYFFCSLFFVPMLLLAQFRNYSNEFLNIGIDAQALGMGKSVVATTNDVNSVYWNPAGLVSVNDYQGSLMHTSYFAGIASYNFIGFAMPVDNKSALGVSIIRFGIDDILNTTELIDGQGNIDYNRIKLFSATDYAFNFAYARKIAVKGLQLGGNAKVIRRIIGDFASSWGFGLDIGVQYNKNKWKIGLMARDISATYNVWSINKKEFEKIKNAIPSKNQELPNNSEITKPKIQLGIARKFELGKHFNLQTEIDLNTRFAETNDLISSKNISINPSIGFELDYNDIVYLRSGLDNFQRVTNFDGTKDLSVQPNFGIGFQYWGIQIDYALTNIGSVGNALYSNVFSIKFDYNFYRKH